MPVVSTVQVRVVSIHAFALLTRILPAQFHPLFGPVLMVTYACLSNTLLLTVLVSVSHQAAAEIPMTRTHIGRSYPTHSRLLMKMQRLRLASNSKNHREASSLISFRPCLGRQCQRLRGMLLCPR